MQYAAVMRHAVFAVTVMLLAACGNAEREAAEEARRNAPQKPEAAPAETVRKDAPAPAPTKQAAHEPDPTKPEEIDRARNQAMIDGRDKDVLKYCEMAKLDDKSNPQALLGCTLAACRINEVETAKKYSKALPKALMDQAKRVCGNAKIEL